MQFINQENSQKKDNLCTNFEQQEINIKYFL